MDLSHQVLLSDTCPPDETQNQKKVIVRVKCPSMTCGVQNKDYSLKLRIRDDDNENRRKKRDEFLRIVGGDRSTAHRWPYIVAIQKNGHFHCGGTIHSPEWVRNKNVDLMLKAVSSLDSEIN